MKKFTLLLSLMGLFIFVQQTKAGDYGFWANTRSDITIDSKLYKLTDGTDLNGTDYVGNYDEANLGSYAIGSSLEVTNITTNTWGSVTGVKYFYIIYKKGERPASPTFTELNLTQISGGNGAENKTWQYTAPAINLTDGITEEGTYAFELYGLAEGTGNADKFEKHDTLNITFVGQITPEKGIDQLINVVTRLSKYRKVKLHIVGNGTLKPLLMKKTQNNRVINWVGFLNSPEKVGEFYAKSDVTVLPTRWDEAFSYIPIESLSSGTAVIASRCGGNMEAIQEKETGYLFTPGKGDELFEILKNVEIPRLWEMGAKGREYILKKHTLKTFGDKYKMLYSDLLKNPSYPRQID